MTELQAALAYADGCANSKHLSLLGANPCWRTVEILAEHVRTETDEHAEHKAAIELFTKLVQASVSWPPPKRHGGSPWVAGIGHRTIVTLWALKPTFFNCPMKDVAEVAGVSNALYSRYYNELIDRMEFPLQKSYGKHILNAHHYRESNVCDDDYKTTEEQ